MTLLEHIRKLPQGRATLKNLLREQARHGFTRAEIDKQIEDMIAAGQLVETRSGHYTAVGVGREYAVGRFHAHRDGYGFVTPETPISNLRGDVYLSKEAAARAMHGDRVVIRIGRIEPDGRANGEIVRVMRHAHPSVVGEFRLARKGYVVVPHDDRIHQWIEIPESMALPVRHSSADRVGNLDPKGIHVETPKDLAGLIVTAQILDFGEDGERPVGRERDPVCTRRLR